MLSTRPESLGEFLVDRHVLSRDDLAHRDRPSRAGPATRCPTVLRPQRARRREGPDRGASPRQSACASSTSPRRRSTPTRATTDPRGRRARAHGDRRRLRGPRSSSSRSPSPATTPRSQAVGTATGYEIIPAAAGRYEILNAHRLGLRPATAAARRASTTRRRRSSDEVDGDDLHVNDLLRCSLDQWRGSDLHLTAGSPPVIRVNGELRPVHGVDRCSTARRSGR